MGVIRTRVGYAGGTKADPTYHNLGDHSETVEVVYNPEVVSYESLLKVFWESHNPVSRPWSRQYMSAIFYHNEEQKSLAIRSKENEESKSGRKMYTEILPVSRFYPAEDYHQKYYLKHKAELKRIFVERFRTDDEFTGSIVAARLNGLIGKHGNVEAVQEELEELGFSTKEIHQALATIGIRADRTGNGTGKVLQGACPVVNMESFLPRLDCQRQPLCGRQVRSKRIFHNRDETGLPVLS